MKTGCSLHRLRGALRYAVDALAELLPAGQAMLAHGIRSIGILANDESFALRSLATERTIDG